MKRLGLFVPLHGLSADCPEAHQQFSAVAELAVDLLQVRALVSASVLAQEGELEELAPAADEIAV